MTTCQVCELRPSIGVACSPLGPISIAYCQTCAERGAEPMWLLEAIVGCCGNIENLSEEFRNIVGYYNGEYITWEEWRRRTNESDEPQT